MSERPRQLAILLVDDDPDVLEITDQMLAQLGYTTITACDPGDAAEILCDPRTQIDALGVCAAEREELEFIGI